MRAKYRWALLLSVLAWPAAAEAQATNPESVVAGDGGEQELLPYRGTSIIYENALGATSFDRSMDLTYNPAYVMSWAFRPRWYLYDSLSARLDFSVELELTDSDWTQSKYEPTISDIGLGFVYSNFYTIPVAELKLSGGVWFNFPSSKMSQARTLYLGLAPTFSIRRDFDVLSGITLTYSFRYTKNFNRYTGPVSDAEQFPCPLNLDDRTECFNMGSRNPSMSFSNSFALDIYFLDQLYFSASVGIINSLLYPVADASVDTLTGPVTVDEDENNTDHRGSMSYALEVGYDVLSYLTLALGVSTVTPQLGDDGSYRAPFVNRYSNVYFDIALSVDGLVTALTDSGDEDATAASESGAVAARW